MRNIGIWGLAAAAIGLSAQVALAESALSPTDVTIHPTHLMAAQQQPANLQGTSGFTVVTARDRNTALTYNAGGTNPSLSLAAPDVTYARGAQPHETLPQK
jgi:hypothetical protein